VVLRRVGDVQWCGIGVSHPCRPHDDSAPLQILNEVLGNAPAGRMHKAIVETGKAPPFSRPAADP
jgi:zinc protease